MMAIMLMTRAMMTIITANDNDNGDDDCNLNAKDEDNDHGDNVDDKDNNEVITGGPRGT